MCQHVYAFFKKKQNLVSEIMTCMLIFSFPKKITIKNHYKVAKYLVKQGSGTN